MTNVNTPIFGSGAFILDQKQGPYSSLSAALTAVPSGDRRQGQPIKIIDSGVTKFYWFRDGIADGNLVQMSADDIAGALKTLTKVQLEGPDTLNASLDTFVSSLTTSGNNTINLPEATDDDIGRQIVVLLSSGSNSTTVQSASDIIAIGGSSPTTQSVALSGRYKFAIFTVTEAATWRLDDGITSYNVLTRDNTSSYTPTSDYHPATKKYVDDSVTGLFDDRGNYDASGDAFPTSGGSGSGGAILKGDVWTISVGGNLGGVAVTSGDTIRALTDTPGQTASNWATTEVNLGYTPENVANKETSALDTSTTKYPSNNVVKTAVDSKAAIASLISSSFGLERQATAISSTTTLGSSDYGKTFPVSASSSSVIVTIPAQSALKEIGFYRTDNSANEVSIIAPSFNGVIYPGGGTTVKLAQYEFVKITSDGTNYFISSQYLYASLFVKTLLDSVDAGAFNTGLGLGALALLNTVDTDQIEDDAITGAKVADGTLTQAKTGDVRILATLTVNKVTNTVVSSYGCTYSSVGTGEYQVIPASPNSTFPLGSLAITDAQFPSGVSIQGVSKISAVSTSYIQVLTEYAGTTYNPEYCTCLIIGVV